MCVCYDFLSTVIQNYVMQCDGYFRHLLCSHVGNSKSLLHTRANVDHYL